jgi:hypothetical protein
MEDGSRQINDEVDPLVISVADRTFLASASYRNHEEITRAIRDLNLVLERVSRHVRRWGRW